jgi:hypothetical protein
VLYRSPFPTRVWNGVVSLRIEFSGSDVHVRSDADRIAISIDGTTHELSREAASRLADAIGDAMASRREFFRTAGEHRADGSYVVSRRGADSSGNEKVFESFERLERLYERMPEEFDAEAVGRTGITGSRRHMILRHFAEHPAFDCETVSRNPLRIEKKATEAMAGEAVIAD